MSRDVKMHTQPRINHRNGGARIANAHGRIPLSIDMIGFVIGSLVHIVTFPGHPQNLPLCFTYNRSPLKGVYATQFKIMDMVVALQTNNEKLALKVTALEKLIHVLPVVFRDELRNA